MEHELELTDPTAVKALFDPLRFRIFGLLRTPRSVPELARELDLPADRLYYHLHRLVDCGLVHQVDARASGRHTERVFGRVAERITFSGDLDLSGESPLRGITQELERCLRSAGTDDTASVSYHHFSLAPARAQELEERLRALISEFDDRTSAADGARTFAVLGALAPMPEAQAG